MMGAAQPQLSAVFPSFLASVGSCKESSSHNNLKEILTVLINITIPPYNGIFSCLVFGLSFHWDKSNSTCVWRCWYTYLHFLRCQCGSEQRLQHNLIKYIEILPDLITGSLTFISICVREVSRTRGMTRKGRVMSLVVRYLFTQIGSVLNCTVNILGLTSWAHIHHQVEWNWCFFLIQTCLVLHTGGRYNHQLQYLFECCFLAYNIFTTDMVTYRQ